jgi:Chlorophyllase enzyme
MRVVIQCLCILHCAVYAVAQDPQDVGGKIIDMIGGLMSVMSPLMSLVGMDAKNIDMRDTLCKGFEGNSLIASIIGPIFGNPNGPTPEEKCMKDDSGGSGPYKSKIVEDPSLANHTIYVPINPPQEKLPVIVWANGFCLPTGMMFANFLAEIASHGFMVISNGAVKPKNIGATTKTTELIKAIDWVTNNSAVTAYGNVDPSVLAVAGQSCGGVNAVSLA